MAKEKVRIFIKSFPTTGTRYHRNNNERGYFEKGLTAKKMYRMYTHIMERNPESIPIVSESTFLNILRTEFSLRFQ